MLKSMFLLVLVPFHADVIGISRPAESITRARIATLPAAQRPAWDAYLSRSERRLQEDRVALAAERAVLKTAVPLVPREGFSNRSMPVDRETAYYKTPEALHTAETILSFQIPNGGWGKNLDMTQPPRQPGQAYTANNLSHFLGAGDFDAPRDPEWNYVGTLDNDATNTELHYLIRMSGAYPGAAGERFRASFLRGVQYLLSAQFPNGGWPQVWPLEGGYHDAITFNDNAVTESAETLSAVAHGEGEYSFIPAAVRRQATEAAAHALTLILATQLRVKGHLTVWAQQHDALTLLPVAGRNFEPAALSAGESSDLLLYLMKLPSPSPAVRASIDAGIVWLKANAIHGQQWTGGKETPPSPENPGGGRHLETAPEGTLIWPRYTSLTTGRPIFGDRDKTIHDKVGDLTLERRNGYAWYSSGPQQALNAYQHWKS